MKELRRERKPVSSKVSSFSSRHSVLSPNCKWWFDGLMVNFHPSDIRPVSIHPIFVEHSISRISAQILLRRTSVWTNPYIANRLLPSWKFPSYLLRHHDPPLTSSLPNSNWAFSHSAFGSFIYVFRPPTGPLVTKVECFVCSESEFFVYNESTYLLSII